MMTITAKPPRSSTTDDAAFAADLEAELPRLARLAIHLARDATTAEDLAQEAAIRPKRAASLAQPVRCWQARRHISGYLDGELDIATKAAVEGHLAGCPTCPPLYAGLVGVRAILGGLRDPDTVVEAAIADRITARLDRRPLGRRR